MLVIVRMWAVISASKLAVVSGRFDHVIMVFT